MSLKKFKHMSIVAWNTIFLFLLQDVTQKQQGSGEGEDECGISVNLGEKTHRLKNYAMASQSH